jgi:hypothetical protein
VRWSFEWLVAAVVLVVVLVGFAVIEIVDRIVQPRYQF